jgi:ribose 5-phosphate isomerase B
MKIAVACDHRGYEAKRKLLPLLKQWGHEPQDFGCDGSGMSDYPDFAIPASRAVAEGQCDAAILVDGSGIGMSIASNKVIGVRAALAHDEVTARIAREYNHCNALCLGADLLSESQFRKIVETFLTTPFADGRHLRRIDKIRELEQSEAKRTLAVPHLQHAHHSKKG